MIRLSDIRINLSRQQTIRITNFTLQKNTLYLLTGHSGSGKTTFLKFLGGYLPSNKIQGSFSLPKSALLLQNPNHQMITSTVKSELQFPLIQQGISLQRINNKVNAIAEFFHVMPLLDEKLCNLSFGELQTVMLATTLLIPADLYLLDEPTSHLDPMMSDRMFQWIRMEGKNKICSWVIASQYPDEYCYADRVLIFENLSLIQDVPAGDYPGLKESESRFNSHETLQY